MMAVLFIDLDGFKLINDTYGHNVGDELLVILAKRLQECIRMSDTVARFGGDEFIILLTGLNSKDEAALVAQKVLSQVQTPIQLSACTADVGASIGIAMYPEDAGSEIELLKIADSLMYQVKYSGKNSYSFLKK